MPSRWYGRPTDLPSPTQSSPAQPRPAIRRRVAEGVDDDDAAALRWQTITACDETPPESLGTWRKTGGSKTGGEQFLTGPTSRGRCAGARRLRATTRRPPVKDERRLACRKGGKARIARGARQQRRVAAQRGRSVVQRRAEKGTEFADVAAMADWSGSDCLRAVCKPNTRAPLMSLTSGVLNVRLRSLTPSL
uniref:Uncharacterized protein n=1 Tax=Plectus sambesii TaxID=2011161 RepID=A0A914X2H8_9BILA